ncbi:MAG: hypothetical protein ABI765_10925 [Gemmatimonadota bacterium]
MPPELPDLFLGRWRLVPELCLYEYGPVPAGGEYLIERTERTVRLSVTWTMTDGTTMSENYAGREDGSWQPHDGPGAEAYTINRIDRHTLDSAAFRAGATIGYARRVASNDGTLLVVVQDGARDNGDKFRNFQLYRRTADR